MNFCEWEKSSADYGRKLLNSGLDGARSGREEFLHGRAIRPLLSESAQHAAIAAAVAAGIGIVGGWTARGHRSAGRALAYGLFGSVLGFGAGVLWENRRLTASVVAGALKNIGKARDEHWLEKNPIDYA